MTDRIIDWIKENKWLVAGLVIAILNPVPSGVVLGIVMLTEERFNRVGKTVLGVSVILVIVIFVIALLTSKG